MDKLTEHVQEWLDEMEEDGYTSAGSDLLQYGCQSGMVSHLIYYVDTIKFYETYQEEIDALLVEMIDSTGLPIHDLFGDKWDKSDPFARETNNQNLLAWFGFEETAYRLVEDE